MHAQTTNKGTEIITTLKVSTAKLLAGKCLSDSNFILLFTALKETTLLKSQFPLNWACLPFLQRGQWNLVQKRSEQTEFFLRVLVSCPLGSSSSVKPTCWGRGTETSKSETVRLVLCICPLRDRMYSPSILPVTQHNKLVGCRFLVLFPW